MEPTLTSAPQPATSEERASASQPQPSPGSRATEGVGTTAAAVSLAVHRAPVTPTASPADSSKNVYIASLPESHTEDDLRRLFSPYGHIISCKMFNNAGGPQSRGGRGYGFVMMDSERAATAAIEGLIGTIIQGQRIQVRKAKATATLSLTALTATPQQFFVPPHSGGTPPFAAGHPNPTPQAQPQAYAMPPPLPPVHLIALPPPATGFASHYSASPPSAAPHQHTMIHPHHFSHHEVAAWQFAPQAAATATTPTPYAGYPPPWSLVAAPHHGQQLSAQQQGAYLLSSPPSIPPNFVAVPGGSGAVAYPTFASLSPNTAPSSYPHYALYPTPPQQHLVYPGAPTAATTFATTAPQTLLPVAQSLHATSPQPGVPRLSSPYATAPPSYHTLP